MYVCRCTSMHACKYGRTHEKPRFTTSAHACRGLVLNEMFIVTMSVVDDDDGALSVCGSVRGPRHDEGKRGKPARCISFLRYYQPPLRTGRSNPM